MAIAASTTDLPLNAEYASARATMTPAGMSTRPVATARINDRRRASQSMSDHSPGRTKP